MKHFRTIGVAGIMGLAGAGGAAAQDANLCGGIGASGQWIGGSPETSDVSTSGGNIDLLTLVPRDGESVALFSVSSPVDVRVEAQGQGGGDPVIELRDETGNLVVSDDDSGGNRASRAEVQLLPGTYCLQTSSFGGDIMMAEVRVGLTEYEPLTEGNISSAGGEVCTADTPAADLVSGPLDALLGTPIEASGSASGSPFWRFSLSRPTPLSITADNPDADPVLTLYDSSGTVLGENDDFSGLNSRLDFDQALPAGDYCIGIRALANEDAPITVGVFEYDERAILEATYATAESAPPLDGSYPVEDLGVIATRLRKDVRVGDTAIWFQFTVDQPGLVLIEGIGDVNADPVLSLFDDLGRPVMSNDDFGGTLDSLLVERMFPGTYILAVHQYSGSTDTEGTIRVVMERFVPAQ